MAFCSQCGNKIPDGSKFCDKCGAEVKGNNQKTNNTAKNIYDAVENLGSKIVDLNNTSDYTTEYDQADIKNNKTFAALSYIAFLFLIPILAAPNSKFARFHSNQGLVLFIVSVVCSVVLSILRIVMYSIADPLGKILSVISWVVGLLLLVLAIIGIINAVQEKAKELPIIGKIKLLK